MIVVISDTSVLCYLVQIGRIDLLKSLFEEITIPGQVLAECCHPGAPPSLREKFSPPLLSFVRIAEVSEFLPETSTLDPGEAAAITLAWQHRSHSLLLLDEKRGRAIAASLGLQIRGVLGLVVEGHRRELLEFDPTITLLRSHGFRIAEPLLLAARGRLGLSTD